MGLALVCFALAILSLHLSRIHCGEKLGPIGIFLGVWFSVFGLYLLKLYPFNDISMEVWFYFLGGALVFYCANVLVYSFYPRKKHSAPSRLLSQRKLRKAVYWSFAIGLFGFLLLFLRIVAKYGFSAFIESPETIHSDFTLQFVGYFYLFNGITPVLAYLYIEKFQDRKALMWMLIGVSLFTLLFSASRTNTLRALVMIYLSLVYLSAIKANLRNIAVIGALAVTFFVGYHFYKNPYLAERLAKTRNFEPAELVVLAPTYGYIAAPFSVFEKRAESLREYEWGINTFNTVARFIKIVWPDMPVRSLGQETEYLCNPVCSNVFTYLDVYYRDFGVWGVYGLTFLQGILVAIFFANMKWRNRPELFMVNAVFGWCLFVSFFSNHFAKNSTIFFLLVAWLIGRYIYVRKASGTARVGNVSNA